MNSIKSPVVLFAYNRLWHIKQTVEALQKNLYAEQSNLFIFSDGPKTEKDESKVKEVREYIKTIKGFRKVEIIERDRNLEVWVGEKETILTYYIFNEPALNTFDGNLAKQRNGKGGYYIVKELPIKVYPLSEIIKEYIPKEQEIDFLTIDVEGKDFEVLKSNDWDRYRPKVVLIEVLTSSLEKMYESPIYIFMREKGYSFFAKTFNTCFFITNEFLKEINK
jgi:hypothetical protein